MRKVVLTGGGSAGHVVMHLALIPRLLERGWSVVYVGSHRGIEKRLISDAGIPYVGIPAGKLRRYLDWRNAVDLVNVLAGMVRATIVLRRERPDVVVSKGGFVALPVVFGAWMNGIPVVVHESDLTPGLANRLSFPMSRFVCATFRESLPHLPRKKTVYVGAIIRDGLGSGSAEAGRRLCGFDGTKPVLLVMGGSQGSRSINGAIRGALPHLAGTYDVIHLCGERNIDPVISVDGYRQFGYLDQELPDVLAAADVVVSRAGSNTIFELLHLRKPMLLIPLRRGSRGDQVLNARVFRDAGFCGVLPEQHLTAESIARSITDVHARRQELIGNMSSNDIGDGLTSLTNILEGFAP